MAITRTKNGYISLENRQCYFDKGIPVNMPEWDWFKKLPDINFNSPIEISDQLIMSTFNEIRDSGTSAVLHTSFDRFEIFCINNKLDFIQNHKNRTYTIMKKFIAMINN